MPAHRLRRLLLRRVPLQRLPLQRPALRRPPLRRPPLRRVPLRRVPLQRLPLRRLVRFPLWLAAAASALAAQGPIPHNTLEHTNWWLTPREDVFPNYETGNVAGDGLFKVVPSTVLERAGDHQVSGYRMAISIDDGYTGSYPALVQVPAVQLYRTATLSVGGSSFEAVDVSRPVGPQFSRIGVVLQTDGEWVIDVLFDPLARDPSRRQPLAVPALENGQRAGLAVMALAEAGAKRAPTNPGPVLVPSFGERHLPPGQPSYSGSYDASEGAVAMYGTVGQPSATAELYLALRFAGPTLQLRSDRAGGLNPDPQGFETYMGPGAYATDLASRGGWLGLYVQAEQHDPGGGAPTHFAFPFVVATSLAGPSLTLPIGAAALRVAPAELGIANALIDGGLFGALTTYAAASGAGFDVDQRGAFASPVVALPANPAWIGATLWIQALVVDASLQPVDATNAVRLTLR